MPKLTEVYDITKRQRSIDPELKRATLKQFFKTAPDYVHIPQGDAADLIVGEKDYIVTDEDGNLVDF